MCVRACVHVRVCVRTLEPASVLALGCVLGMY